MAYYLKRGLVEDRNAPATKGDIADLEPKIGSLDQRVDRLEQKVDRLQIEMELHRSEVNHRFNDVIERMADGETRLLKAFYDFAQTNEKRLTVVEAVWQPSKTEC